MEALLTPRPYTDNDPTQIVRLLAANKAHLRDAVREHLAAPTATTRFSVASAQRNVSYAIEDLTGVLPEALSASVLGFHGQQAEEEWKPCDLLPEGIEDHRHMGFRAYFLEELVPELRKEIGKVPQAVARAVLALNAGALSSIYLDAGATQAHVRTTECGDTGREYVALSIPLAWRFRG